MQQLVNFSDPLFWRVTFLIISAPVIWNAIARTEYYTKFLQKMTGSKFTACYIITAWVFGYSTFRDYVFSNMLGSQPVLAWMTGNMLLRALAALLVVGGQVFVLSSFYRLGITGTFLGDYCGILMDAPVTGFPFSVLNNPMYVGSSVCFVGYSVWSGSVAGLLLSALVFVVYQGAIQFEEPFTRFIYEQKAASKEGKRK